MDLAKYRKIFIQESENYLGQLEGLLLQVEEKLQDKELWTEVHGKIHSIKGMARALSLEKITDLAHAMEAVCKGFQSGDRESTPQSVQLLSDGVDLLKLLVASMGEIPSLEDQRWYDSLVSSFKKGPEEFTDIESPDRPKKLDSVPTPKIDYVRVNYSLIEELLGFSQEILLLEKSLPPISLEQVSRGLKNWIDNYMSMLKGLHFRLAQLRLVSVSDFVDMFQKSMKKLARENGKKVSMEVTGGWIQADITLLERLREPFIHILRNSIAHGVETPEERVSLGKEPEGKISLEVSRDRDRLLMKIRDDGRGINESAIIEHLKRKGMSDESISALSRQEFFDTILSPDFSSSSKADDMSGRGIGMNLVVQVIEYLGGTMSIHSVASKGTELRIKLPVYLSIIHSIVFIVGGYTLAIPTSAVISVDRKSRMPEDELESRVDLRAVLGKTWSEDQPCNIVKIRCSGDEDEADSEDHEVNLLVDSIVGNKPLMVMPVGELLAKAKLFAGVGILENGEISVLLDVASLPRNRADWAR